MGNTPHLFPQKYTSCRRGRAVRKNLTITKAPGRHIIYPPELHPKTHLDQPRNIHASICTISQEQSKGGRGSHVPQNQWRGQQRAFSKIGLDCERAFGIGFSGGGFEKPIEGRLPPSTDGLPPNAAAGRQQVRAQRLMLCILPVSCACL